MTMSKFFQRFSKPRSSDQQAVNLEPDDPSGRHQERPSRLRLPWSSRSSTSRSSSSSGISPTPTPRLQMPTPQLTTRPPPVAPPPPVIPLAPVTPSPSEPPSIHGPAPPVISTSVVPIERIWQRSIDLAQEKLKEKKLPLLELSDPTCKSVADISSTVGELKRTIDQGGNGPGVGCLRKILKTIASYGRIVDTAIQHNPAITALVWAGIRAILQVR